MCGIDMFSCVEPQHQSVLLTHALCLNELLHKVVLNASCCDALAVRTCFIQVWRPNSRAIFNHICVVHPTPEKTLPFTPSKPIRFDNPLRDGRLFFLTNFTKAPSKFSPEFASSLCSGLLWCWPGCRLMEPSEMDLDGFSR